MDIFNDQPESTIPTSLNIILDSDIPNMLLKHGDKWIYYIIGGRAYNMIMKIPVRTVDYDIKFETSIEEVSKIRDLFLGTLKSKYRNLDFISDDRPKLARLSVNMSGKIYDLIDFGVISEEQITKTYDIRNNVIIGNNGLRYGGLEYLLRRLDEIVILRHDEVEVIKQTRELLDVAKTQIDIIISLLPDTINKNLRSKLNVYVKEFGKSSEADRLIGSNIKTIISKITDILIDQYNLDDLDDYNKFINSDSNTWTLKNRPNGLNFDNPFDIIIGLYNAEYIYSSSDVINADLAEKIDKYERTLSRYNTLLSGLSEPQKYFSLFFIEYLSKLCNGHEKIETFLNRYFDCNLIRQ